MLGRVRSCGYTRFHPNGFQMKSESIGFKRLRFNEHTCGFTADVCYQEFSY